MSQSATWDTLMIARDARLSGRLDVAAELMREVDQDLPAYSHLYCRTTMSRVLRAPRDFLAWVGTPAAARLDAVMRSQRLFAMAPARIPQWDIPHDGDGIEIRVRSWANFVEHRSYAFFPEIV